jgi:uncharacterized protein with HEPN domain
VSRGDEQILEDLFETAEKLATLVAKGKEHFLTEIEGQWAIERGILNIGEYATVLSVEFKEAHPEVDWKRIIGMRTFLAHAYHMIDEERVWQAASVKVPELVIALKK